MHWRRVEAGHPQRTTRPSRVAPKRRCGGFNLPRFATVCAILAAILLVPLYMLKGKAKAQRGIVAAEQAKTTVPTSSGAAAAAPADAPANDPDRFALTFGWMPATDNEQVHASCHGEPKGLARPHRDSCNPYSGDTSCRTELPLLCGRPADANGPYALATAPAVAGFLLKSQADADARCAEALGAGWRMARFHDGGGWELRGGRSVGALADTRLRSWVAIGDQRASCWDRP